ncbi:MAG: T9SS type A sorting domain-containing protein [bacterium]|nr:MAG: T9SS type A sorting domain-containing protein [bacterium]
MIVRKFPYFIIVLLIFALVGLLNGSYVDASEQISGKTIVVLGSSTAEGIGPSHPDSAWVNRYRKYIISLDSNSKVTNLAYRGYTTYHIMPDGYRPPHPTLPSPDQNRNISKALALYADAVIINLPSNDAARGYSVKDQLANYDSILSVASTAGIPVWISTTQPRNLTSIGLQNLMEMRDSTFARFGEKAIDFWYGLARDDGRINSKYDCGDGIHLSNAGHRILFGRVVEKAIFEVITGISETIQTTPQTFKLYYNYPNPFNYATIISFDLMNHEYVKLVVYNIKGQEIEVLVDKQLSPGNYRELFLADKLASGLYFFRLATENAVATGKMNLMK